MKLNVDVDARSLKTGASGRLMASIDAREAGGQVLVSCRRCGVWRSGWTDRDEAYEGILTHAASGECRSRLPVMVRRYLSHPVPMWLSILMAAVCALVATR